MTPRAPEYHVHVGVVADALRHAFVEVGGLLKSKPSPRRTSRISGIKVATVTLADAFAEVHPGFDKDKFVNHVIGGRK